MQTIRDKDGRAYDLSLNIQSYRRVKQDTGIDLTLTQSPGPSGQPLIVDLFGSAIVLLDVLWSIVRPNAQKEKVSRDTFEAGFFGPAFVEARQAFIEELELFFQTLGRDDEAEMIKAVPGAERTNLAKIIENLRSGAGDQQTTSLKSGAESSESPTPDDSPSAN